MATFGSASTPAPGRGASAARTLTPRTLITVGVYAAIYFVLMFIPGMLGILGPVLGVVGFFIGLLLGGTVVMLLFARTRTFGAFTIFCVLIGLLMVLTGQVWYSLICAAVLGAAGDWIASLGRYRLGVQAWLGYTVFSVTYMTLLLPLVIDPQAYYAMVEATTSAEYASSTQALFSPLFLVVYGVLTVVVAFVGGWLGSRLVSKHFTHR